MKWDATLPLFRRGPRINTVALEDDERAVADVLNQRVGADQAVQVKAMAAAVGIPPRRVQSIVQHLIHKHDAPIGTRMSAPYGWYLAETQAELDQVVALHKARAMKELATMARLKRTKINAVLRQIQTELEDVA